MPDTEPQNKQLFYTIEMLDKAIIKGRQVAFYYNEYHTDMKNVSTENEKGKNADILSIHIKLPQLMADII